MTTDDLSARRAAKSEDAPEPGEAVLTIEDDGRVVFASSEALVEYVRSAADEAPVVTEEQAVEGIALDLQGAYRNMLARAADSDEAADNLTASARGERAVAVEFRAKAAALADHLRTLGIDVPEDAPVEPEGPVIH